MSRALFRSSVLLSHLRPISRGCATTPSSEDVIFTSVDTSRVITLNRPKHLNALNLSMIRKIYEKMNKYEKNPSIKLVLMKGNGEKAYCAGGDIKAVTEAGLERRKNASSTNTLSEDFFREEYKLNYLIGTYEIPFIAIIDGITMGGGVGLSLHGGVRVATERTVFAMPETHIGFFPDVGGSWFLPRLRGQLGTFLALTGHRLVGWDTVEAGIATHFVKSDRVQALETELLQMKQEKITRESVDLSVRAFDFDTVPMHKQEFSLLPHLEKIDRIFSPDTVEEIVENLKRDGSDFARKQLERLKLMSPTSLKVTLAELRKGARLANLKECLSMEYRMSQRMMEGVDFYEGVRSVLVDKDNKPRWKPASLAEVADHDVEHYFEPFPDPERELQLVD